MLKAIIAPKIIARSSSGWQILLAFGPLKAGSASLSFWISLPAARHWARTNGASTARCRLVDETGPGRSFGDGCANDGGLAAWQG